VQSASHIVTVDGNEAVASVAHRTNEVIAIYPITPASPMGELADAWSVQGRRNLWGTVPDIIQLQSEGGAAGTCHGALQAGALTTTFTASQGLLLMIPNLYKIAGELTPFCVHVAARTVATHALSIFGDHSDVMAARQTGFALLASGSVQEAHDLAAIAQAATLVSRVPFLHFFDGFRTSHEIAKIDLLSDEDLRAVIDDDAVRVHRERALTPDRPVIRGTAQNPDVFFQAREASNPYYAACPGIVQATMDQLAGRTGRQYHLFDYVGHPEAEWVVVMMGSGAETAHETVEHLVSQGEKVGLVKVRLYRPFAIREFVGALPATVRAITVLDRTKEPGAVGEPLWLDVVAALHEARAEGWSPLAEDPRVIGGRYGLSSKEFDPAMVKASLDEARAAKPRRHFTVGIVDDVSGTSLAVDPEFAADREGVFEAVFYGLGSDGTVGANKNTIKILGEETSNFVQAYFVYDSKKAGAVTVSHLRLGPAPIRSSYLVKRASFVACHQFDFLDRFEVLGTATPGAIFLLNAPCEPDEVWDRLPHDVQSTILEKKLELWTIDAHRVARETGLGVRINTIMQTCFFAISGVLPRDEAVERIKDAIRTTYEKRGSVVVSQNFEAVDAALDHLHRVELPERVTAERSRPPVVSEEAPDFVQRVTAMMLANQGDLLPVSAFPPDGTWPTGTSQWEKRNLAQEIPVWDSEICIQCNRCALACPHAAIRAKVYDPARLDGAPSEFRHTESRGEGLTGLVYTLQVAPEDCTGCGLCVEVCPVKDKANPRHKAIDMEPQPPRRDVERESYRFFLDLPEADRTSVAKIDARGSQLFEPLFEYSGACAGCGETPYLKLLSQLFGDRMLIANATGCSSIFGGNLPTTPWTVNADGRGPAWSNSLFEDNAEFGLGFRLAVDAHRDQAAALLATLAADVGERLVADILEADPTDEGGLRAQRDRVTELREKLAATSKSEARRLEQLADYLVKKSVWIVGGDGWAYDIGYGGLDHVLAQNRDVNVLVLDTEVYSNTGGQQSKATPLGAAAKFAASGKETPKKDLGLETLSQGQVYVAQVAFGSNMNQVVRALREADSFRGPSLVIAYSHCIAHGYDLRRGADQQKLAVQTGLWPLYRFDPRRVAEGQPPLHLDSREPKIPLSRFMENETRFRMVEKMDPKRFGRLAKRAQTDVAQRFAFYDRLAGLMLPPESTDGDADSSDRAIPEEA
jgi:pyruvate-ferredoxin/flavodoxin oxidoreductase